MMIKKDGEGNYVVSKSIFFVFVSIVFASIFMVCFTNWQLCKFETELKWALKSDNRRIDVVVHTENPCEPMPPVHYEGKVDRAPEVVVPHRERKEYEMMMRHNEMVRQADERLSDRWNKQMRQIQENIGNSATGKACVGKVPNANK